MPKANKPTIVERQLGRIHARLIDEWNGLQVISGIRAVRIRDRHARILIMEDYLPTLGKIEGDVAIVTTEGEITYDAIVGFYKHQHNEFTLLIERDENDNVDDFSLRPVAVGESSDEEPEK